MKQEQAQVVTKWSEEMGRYGKVVKSVKKFEGKDDFEAVNKAENAARVAGLAIGSMCNDKPRALANSKKIKYIAKWYNIPSEEYHKIEGLLVSDDFRNGDVYMVLFK